MTQAVVQPEISSTPAIEGGSSAGFHIPSLDGIRAVAILIVFLSHGGLGSWIPGTFGVTIFFFLSGYLITTLLRLEMDRHDHINFRQFYLRRTLRIFPPLYAYLLLSLLLAWFGLTAWPQLMAFSAELFYVTNFYLIRHGSVGLPAGSVVLWSLAIEEHFYLLFPLIYVLIRKTFRQGRTQGLFLLLLCGIVMLWRCWLVYSLPASPERALRIDHGTDTRFDSMLFGCALALWGNPSLESPLWSPTILKRLMLPLATLAMLFSLLYRSDAFRDSVRFTLQGLALFPIFTAAIQFPKSPLFAPLNWRPVRFIGVLSYTIYLVHLTTIMVMEKYFHQQLVVAIVAAAVAILIATASYYLLELPCARLRKRYSRVHRPNEVRA
jgi:peptidoglycan/LPS O-acetylase OafA/YrhL